VDANRKEAERFLSLIEDTGTCREVGKHLTVKSDRCEVTIYNRKMQHIATLRREQAVGYLAKILAA